MSGAKFKMEKKDKSIVEGSYLMEGQSKECRKLIEKFAGNWMESVCALEEYSGRLKFFGNFKESLLALNNNLTGKGCPKINLREEMVANALIEEVYNPVFSMEFKTKDFKIRNITMESILNWLKMDKQHFGPEKLYNPRLEKWVNSGIKNLGEIMIMECYDMAKNIILRDSKFGLQWKGPVEVLWRNLLKLSRKGRISKMHSVFFEEDLDDPYYLWNIMTDCLENQKGEDLFMKIINQSCELDRPDFIQRMANFLDNPQIEGGKLNFFAKKAMDDYKVLQPFYEKLDNNFKGNDFGSFLSRFAYQMLLKRLRIDRDASDWVNQVYLNIFLLVKALNPGSLGGKEYGELMCKHLRHIAKYEKDEDQETRMAAFKIGQMHKNGPWEMFPELNENIRKEFGFGEQPKEVVQEEGPKKRRERAPSVGKRRQSVFYPKLSGIASKRQSVNMDKGMINEPVKKEEDTIVKRGRSMSMKGKKVTIQAPTDKVETASPEEAAQPPTAAEEITAPPKD